MLCKLLNIVFIVSVDSVWVFLLLHLHTCQIDHSSMQKIFVYLLLFNLNWWYLTCQLLPYCMNLFLSEMIELEILGKRKVFKDEGLGFIICTFFQPSYPWTYFVSVSLHNSSPQNCLFTLLVVAAIWKSYGRAGLRIFFLFFSGWYSWKTERGCHPLPGRVSRGKGKGSCRGILGRQH